MANSATRSGLAVNAVAALINEFGRDGFNVSDRSQAQLQELCEAWIDHLMNGAPSPASQEMKEDWLDWPGVRDFFAQQRKIERDFVEQNLASMREVVLTLLDTFSDSVQAEHASDDAVQSQLLDLRESAKVKSADELRDHVQSTVQYVAQFIDEKKNQRQDKLQQLGAQIRELREELLEVKETAAKDGLTGLHNRAGFDEHLERALQLHTASGEEFVLLMIDIDHFKALNDNHGHPFGDEVLKEVAACLPGVFVRDADFCARYGGEEFAIVAPCTIANAKILGVRLLQRVRALEFTSGETPVSVTISIGIAPADANADAQEWLQRADRALYQSKTDGRDRMTVSG